VFGGFGDDLVSTEVWVIAVWGDIELFAMDAREGALMSQDDPEYGQRATVVSRTGDNNSRYRLTTPAVAGYSFLSREGDNADTARLPSTL
jgi:hypothetical protein